MPWNDFLDHPIDYSESFTERVENLAQSLSTVLNVTVHHGSDMNYNPGQTLTVYLLSDGSVTPEPRAARCSLKIVISSRGPLWALLVLRKEAQELEWFPSSVNELRGEHASEVVAAVGRTMEEAGLDRVADEDLEQWVPGRVTQLDGAPATVRDVLFCELC